jgi:hypothetical protein
MGRGAGGTPTEVVPPDAVYTRQRYIPVGTIDWVNDCDRILTDYGAVVGVRIYRSRGAARWHAQKLVRLFVELRLHERWELVEHTGRRGDGWVWSVEYVGNGGRSVNFH